MRDAKEIAQQVGETLFAVDIASKDTMGTTAL
jgi:hypothetical protein